MNSHILVFVPTERRDEFLQATPSVPDTEFSLAVAFPVAFPATAEAVVIIDERRLHAILERLAKSDLPKLKAAFVPLAECDPLVLERLGEEGVPAFPLDTNLSAKKIVTAITTQLQSLRDSPFRAVESALNERDVQLAFLSSFPS